MNWGLHIKRLREERHMTQAELARRAGISRSYLAQVEIGRYESYRGTTFKKLAKGLEMIPEHLASEIYGKPGGPDETPDELLERLKLALPECIPVYDVFPIHAGEEAEPVSYVYRFAHKPVGGDMSAHIIRGDCLEPEIKDQDIVVIDKSAPIDVNNIIVALTRGVIVVGKLKKIADELWLENNKGRIKLEECEAVSVVIQIVRRLK